MPSKVNLRIVLFANDVSVVETDDAALWQHTLAAITGTREAPGQFHGPTTSISTGSTSRPDELRPPEPYGNGNGAGALEHFAGELKLDPAAVQGTCDPTTEQPYMHLEVRAWQEFKRNTAPRGTTSNAPIVIAATLLVLWFKTTRLGAVTVSQAQAVLNTIDIRDKNPARGLKNCGWLQSRDDVITLNPTRYDQAIILARAFCSQQPIPE